MRTMLAPLYPPPLTPGSLIAVTAPSSGVEPRLHRRLDLVLQHLRDQGFRVEEGRCLRDEAAQRQRPGRCNAPPN
jgi:muramoyltetrapeptide carboxypeptidase